MVPAEAPVRSADRTGCGAREESGQGVGTGSGSRTGPKSGSEYWSLRAIPATSRSLQRERGEEVVGEGEHTGEEGAEEQFRGTVRPRPIRDTLSLIRLINLLTGVPGEGGGVIAGESVHPSSSQSGTQHSQLHSYHSRPVS